MLRQLATPDFDHRVWERLDETSLAELPLAGADAGSPTITAIEYRGAVTRMTVSQGSRELTYVLRNWNGKLRVDDVLARVPKRPSSLKTILELMVPIHEFAAGIRTLQIELLGRNSSADFNRLVWKQTEAVPNVGSTVFDQLRSALASVDLRVEKAIVKLGDESFGAHVELLKEHDRWVVDEVLLITGLEPAHRRQLKKTLRIELANNFKTRRRTHAPQTGPDPIEPATGQSEPPPAVELAVPPRDRAPQPTAVPPSPNSGRE
jgi:hypothetical protein